LEVKAMPIYMKIEGYEGPVTGKYKGYIELQSCQLGTNRNIGNSTGTGSNKEASAPASYEVVITKNPDDSSAFLFTEALSGKGRKITVVFVRDNDAPYLSIDLENALISGYNLSGHGGDNHVKPMESLTINAAKISYSTVATAAPKGSKASADRTQWDLVAGPYL
jgi:type VI protein secretion system component Hcp